MINHRERIENCLSQEEMDRTPVALWRHFPVDDQNPQDFAAATIEFQKRFDFDLVKVTPSSSFCLRDWGVVDKWRGSTEGTREYTQRIINNPEDWEQLNILNPMQGSLGAQLHSLELILKELGSKTPVIQTIFNPLSQAKNLAGKERLLVHMRRYPDALHQGLHAIKETTIRYIEALKEVKVSGVFYAVQHAQYSLLTEDEYREFGKEYDLIILEPAEDFWLNMLHIHGSDIMFNLLADYPVQIINWHDRETYPSLKEAKEIFPRVLCGGLNRSTIVFGTPQDIVDEAQTAVESTGDKGFILGTGCVVPITAPYGNILAARKSVD